MPHSHGVHNITIEHANLTTSNTQASENPQMRPTPEEDRVIHGAITIMSDQPDQQIEGVTIKDITIDQSHPDGYDEVQVLSWDGAPIQHVWLDDITITSSRWPGVFTTGPSTYNTTGWTYNGTAKTDHIGW